MKWSRSEVRNFHKTTCYKLHPRSNKVQHKTALCEQSPFSSLTVHCRKATSWFDCVLLHHVRDSFSRNCEKHNEREADEATKQATMMMLWLHCVLISRQAKIIHAKSSWELSLNLKPRWIQRWSYIGWGSVRWCPRSNPNIAMEFAQNDQRSSQQLVYIPKSINIFQNPILNDLLKRLCSVSCLNARTITCRIEFT